MNFTIVRGRSLPRNPQEGCYLHEDSWNDFGFVTMFRLQYVDSEGNVTNFGAVKIAQRGQESGATPIPQSFERLDDSYFSLGTDQNYYESINDSRVATPILEALRDCINDPELLAAVRGERAFKDSLTRSTKPGALSKFREILIASETATPFNFELKLGPKGPRRPSLSFTVLPGSTPPTNIHAVIGRNGVGKSHFLHYFASALVHPTQRRRNEFVELGAAEQFEFTNIVAVAFSAFDNFEPLKESTEQRVANYHYVGLRVLKGETTDEQEPEERVKGRSELGRDFSASLENCLGGPRERRWIETTRLLCSDPGFAAIGLTSEESHSSIDYEGLRAAFETLSSGHKIALLMVTKLVQFVDNKTLVLIDEPESHLHPPLLSSLVRAVSHLLAIRNGVAIVATHSPVVLQEVPRSCVWILRRQGTIGSAERPSIETFGENIGTLTREVFQLETTATGFNRLVAELATGRTYDEVVALFGEQLGGEARAVARIETETHDSD